MSKAARFGTVHGLAVPTDTLSASLPARTSPHARAYKIRVLSGAFARLIGDFRAGEFHIPLWLNHARTVLGRVTSLVELDSGLWFEGTVDDGSAGRMLPAICNQAGRPLGLSGESAACLDVSAGFDGLVDWIGDGPSEIAEYDEITRLNEISILSAQREGAFFGAAASFRLASTGRPGLDAAKAWLWAHSGTDTSVDCRPALAPAIREYRATSVTHAAPQGRSSWHDRIERRLLDTGAGYGERSPSLR